MFFALMNNLTKPCLLTKIFMFDLLISGFITSQAVLSPEFITTYNYMHKTRLLLYGEQENNITSLKLGM